MTRKSHHLIGNAAKRQGGIGIWRPGGYTGGRRAAESGGGQCLAESGGGRGVGRILTGAIAMHFYDWRI